MKENILAPLIKHHKEKCASCVKKYAKTDFHWMNLMPGCVLFR